MANVRTAFLPELAVIAVVGRDARSFLQGQLSNDILGLERHPGMLAAFCNPQGRVLKYQLRDEGRTPATWDLEASGIRVSKR